MILPMTVVAVTIRKTLERTCPKCGNKQTFRERPSSGRERRNP
jgi:hypothetical protein